MRFRSILSTEAETDRCTLPCDSLKTMEKPVQLKTALLAKMRAFISLVRTEVGINSLGAAFLLVIASLFCANELEKNIFVDEKDRLVASDDKSSKHE